MAEFDPTSRFGSAGGETADPPPPDADESSTGPAAAKQLVDEMQVLAAAAMLYLTAALDRLKLAGRRTLVAVVLGLVALVGAISVLATAAALLVTGVAGGLGQLFGGRLWLGQLTTGAGILALLALGCWGITTGWNARNRRQTIERYQQQQAELARRRRAADTSRETQATPDGSADRVRT